MTTPQSRSSTLGYEARRLRYSQAVHVSFAAHHVSVSSNSAVLLSRFASNLEPMLRLQPTGAEAGAFSVNEIDGGFRLQEDGSNALEPLHDLASMVRELHHRVVRRFIEVRPDLLWIHAGAVSFGGRAIVLVGPSGQGKSTIVEALLDWGCSYLSDEIAPIDPITVAVLPFPVSPWKRAASQEYLPPERMHELTKVQVQLVPRSVSQAPVPISHVYFVCHNRPPFSVRLDACSPSVAVVELLKNSFNLDESRVAEIERLCKVTSRVDATHLSYAHAKEAASHIIVASSSD